MSGRLSDDEYAFMVELAHDGADACDESVPYDKDDNVEKSCTCGWVGFSSQLLDALYCPDCGENTWE